MRIEIEAKHPEPPSGQIVQHVRFAVASGRLAPGDRVPSVRALATESNVNPNTAAKAYRDLEREGVLEARPGDGFFVSSKARVRCIAHRDRVLRERIARLADEARAAGWTAGRFAEAMTRAAAERPWAEAEARP